MTPGSPPQRDESDEIAGRVRRLRQVAPLLRQRHPREVLDVLGLVLESFRSRTTPARLRLEADLPQATGFTQEMVRKGLDLALEGWDAAALRALAERELGPFDGAAVSGHDVTAVILGGALPSPTLLSLVAPLALRSPVIAKTARHDSVTAFAFARALAAADPDLAGALEVVSFAGDDAAQMRALLGANCVVATGSDETISAIAAQVAPWQRFVGYGHRLSIALLGPGALRGVALETAARGVALDVALWDQLGCLSCVSVFVQGDARAVGEAIAGELALLASRLPRGRIGREDAVAFAHARDEAEMRAAAGQGVSVHGDGEWVVVCEASAEPRPSPRHRFVRIHPATSDAVLRAALRPLGPHLAGVALAGFGGDTMSTCASLAALGASRICAPGRLQAPPLGWHHDGRGVLLPLARFTDIEIA